MLSERKYMNDSTFLSELDNLSVKELYVKLTALTWDEDPIQEIQGITISGTLNVAGNSTVRRTCNLTMYAEEENNDLSQVDKLFSINKKVRAEIGIKNTIADESIYKHLLPRGEINKDMLKESTYAKYGDIIWFPLGIFIIFNPSLSHSLSGVTISLQLKDKMSLLNGDAGGVLPAAVTFHEREEEFEDGTIEVTKPTLYQIIVEAVNHFGGENLTRIIVADLDTRIKQVMKYTGSMPLFVFKILDNSNTSYEFYINETEAYERELELKNIIASAPYIDYSIKQYKSGEDVGYIYTDFIYPGELIGDAGSTVCDVLDKIIGVLGNFEYFYDVDGNFVFQEIKNYLNTTYTTTVLEKMQNPEYQADFSQGKSVYTFEGTKLVTSYSNSPQFNNIKNDFMVWGIRETADGTEIPIRYHLAIDDKPEIGAEYETVLYTDSFNNTKAVFPTLYDTQSDFPVKGKVGKYYKDLSTNLIYLWNGEGYVEVPKEDITTIVVNDWREELYFQGVAADPYGTHSNYYYTELKNEWPKLYDLKKGEFKEEVLADPSSIDYFLDIIDTTSNLQQYSVKNIGRRSMVVVDNDINCIFAPDIPDLVFININAEDAADIREECERKSQDYAQLEESIYSLFSIGGSANSAYNKMRELLYLYTTVNNSISISALPVYYLEPNTRITVRDENTGIYGDFMISTISLPLDTNGLMTISAYRALERV